MHLNNYNSFTYIDNLNQEEILKLNKNVNLILRNYKKSFKNSELTAFVNFCKKNKKKIFLSNDFKRAKYLNFDGVYIPSFNKLPVNYKIGVKKNFKSIGSAHNINEILIKINQRIDIIFLSPLFKNQKNSNYLGVIKFNLIKKNFKNKFIALGGINNKNINLLKMIDIYGYAAISHFKNKN